MASRGRGLGFVEEAQHRPAGGSLCQGHYGSASANIGKLVGEVGIEPTTFRV